MKAAWSASGLGEREFRQYMQQMGWPQERIDAAFGELKKNEVLVAVTGDLVIVGDALTGREIRRIPMYPAPEVKRCKTCGHELS